MAMALDTWDVIAIVEDYKDSAIFCKLIDDKRFIFGSLDGTISLMTFEEEINSTSIDEDITKMMIAGDRVLICRC